MVKSATKLMKSAKLHTILISFVGSVRRIRQYVVMLTSKSLEGFFNVVSFIVMGTCSARRYRGSPSTPFHRILKFAKRKKIKRNN